MDLSAVAVEMKKLTNSFCNCLFCFLYCYFMEDNNATIRLGCVCVCVWSDSEYIWKVKTTGFADGLGLEVKETEVKDHKGFRPEELER